MKIAFLGDSITEGLLGVSFFDMLVSELPSHELVNFGKGGDTVLSLHKRIKRLDLSSFDTIVLFIGVNDQFSKLTVAYRLLKMMMMQNSSKNLEQFKQRYIDLLDFLGDKRIIVIPPLVLGEDGTNKWNKVLGEYTNIIDELVQVRENVSFINVRKTFLAYLSEKTISDYLPYHIPQLQKDTLLSTSQEIDEVATKRGLHLTLDGVHINSKGASMIKDAIKSAI